MAPALHAACGAWSPSGTGCIWQGASLKCALHAGHMLNWPCMLVLGLVQTGPTNWLHVLDPINSAICSTCPELASYEAGAAMPCTQSSGVVWDMRYMHCTHQTGPAWWIQGWFWSGPHTNTTYQIQYTELVCAGGTCFVLQTIPHAAYSAYQGLTLCVACSKCGWGQRVLHKIHGAGAYMCTTSSMYGWSRTWAICNTCTRPSLQAGFGPWGQSMVLIYPTEWPRAPRLIHRDRWVWHPWYTHIVLQITQYLSCQIHTILTTT